MQTCKALLAALAMLATSIASAADPWPANIAQKLAEALKQPVVVENRGGAGGTIGADSVAKAPADGTRCSWGTSARSTSPSLYPNLPYDPATSFAPIGIVHLPYRGTAPSVTDVIGGQVALTMTGVPPVIEFVRNGRRRALGVSSLKRVSSMPDVPTIAESGVKDFEATQWYALVAPAGTPAAVVARLNGELRHILESAEIRQRLESLGAIAEPGTPDQLTARIASERERWREVVQKAHIRAE